MPAAIVDSDGSVRQLDARAGEQINVTADDVKDPEKLARLLQQALRESATLRGRWAPRVLFFRNQDVTAGSTLRLTHNFNGLAHGIVYAWQPTTPGDAALFEYNDDDTTADTLALDVGNAGKVTIMVVEAG